MTATPKSPNNNETDTLGIRDTRTLFPLWRITGNLILETPLSLGSGHEETITLNEDDEERYVVTVTRDCDHKPYISASSFKGALKALAANAGMSPDIIKQIFGEQGQNTTPGKMEFCNQRMIGTPPVNTGLPGWNTNNHPHTANLAHGTRNRDYGTAEDKHLFLEQVVPPGYEFAFECTARDIDESCIQSLLGLLSLAGASDSPLRLGSGKSADNGKISWQQGEVRKLSDLSALWKALQNNLPMQSKDIWSDTFAPKVTSLIPLALTAKQDNWLNLGDFQLKFHTPFLVYQRAPKNPSSNSPDGTPRLNHVGKGVLPADSFHGALRSQAERILRTLGEETPFGYKVSAVWGVDKAAILDLASVLFGAPGWRSVIRLSDFVEQGDAERIPHEMVAIDRLTGGGKDTAKFSIQVLDCPTLGGSLRVDMCRLNKLEKSAPV